MSELVFKPTGGLGNTLIQLTSVQPECTRLHDSVFDYELGNCITIHGFTRVSENGPEPLAPIYINPYTFKYIHAKIRDIIEPTPLMRAMIETNRGILNDVSCGFSIRRGSYCADSRQYKDSRSDRPEHFFCSSTGLKQFEEHIRAAPGYVFVSSDSKSTMSHLIHMFGDKIRTIDTPFTMIMEQDQDQDHELDYHSIFLKFFLLSECPYLYLTGGERSFVGFSTFAYAAAIYGNKPFNIIMNS